MGSTLLDEFATQYPFPLDDFQRRAIATLETDRSVLVAAPTGSGKTIVAEFAIMRALREGSRVFYTTPIKALSNQKYADLRARHGDLVGLLTGDISENPGGRILVMTTEIVRNMLMQTPDQLTSVGCLIFDEIHYLADAERGTTWEESIILVPPSVQLVCLSATVSNAAEIAAWISRTHRPIDLISHPERPVPLSLFYFFDNQLLLTHDAAGRLVHNPGRVGGENRQRLLQRGRGGRRGGPPRQERPEPSPVEIVTALDDASMLPAIYFLFSRRDCEAAADQLLRNRRRLIRDPAQLAEIDAVLARHLAPLHQRDLTLGQVKTIARLAREGIGYHHAGLLPPLKRLVEDLFTRGLMGVVFATDTLALGVNMPARSVVIGRMDKYDGVQRRLLIANEFQQMAGRAGRRGLDAEGFVVIPYSPWIGWTESVAIATGPLQPVMSSFRIRYNSVLNLWDPPRGDRVRLLLQRSLHAYQTDRRLREIETEAEALQAEIDMLVPGCAAGHPAGEALLDEYELVGRQLASGRDRLRQLEREEEQLRQEVDRQPWASPSREVIRQALRVMTPGTALHHQRDGWGLYLGRTGGNGHGQPLFLFGLRAGPLTNPRQIDYLPPAGSTVALPLGLTALERPIDDVTGLLSPTEQASLLEAIGQLDLPDLAAWRSDYRRQRAAELATPLRRISTALSRERQAVAVLLRTRDQHACETCEFRKQHQHQRQLRHERERAQADVTERLRRQIRREEERVERLVGGIAGVLHWFRYLDHGQPTPKAAMLANIFDSNGLLLVEAIEHGWLADLEADDLAEVCSWFAYDRDARFANHFTLSEPLLRLRRSLEELEWEIVAQERQYDLAITTGFNRLFCGAIRAWCRGDDLTAIANQIELSEGDLVMTFNKTIDLMRQLREMLLASQTHPQLRDRLEWAIKLVQRDIVEQSYRLSFLLNEDEATPTDPQAAPATDEPLPASQATTLVSSAKRRAAMTRKPKATVAKQAGVAATGANGRRRRRQPEADRQPEE